MIKLKVQKQKFQLSNQHQNRFVVCGFRPNREFFAHMETSPLREGLQILTYTRHSWPLSSECSFACHTLQ